MAFQNFKKVRNLAIIVTIRDIFAFVRNDPKKCRRDQYPVSHRALILYVRYRWHARYRWLYSRTAAAAAVAALRKVRSQAAITEYRTPNKKQRSAVVVFL